MQINDEAEQRENIEIGEDHRIIAVDDRFEGEKPEPVEREDRLDQQRAGEKGARRRRRESRR